jgi:hypothetical protein
MRPTAALAWIRTPRPVPWVRSPRRLDAFTDVTPAECKLYIAINAACQTSTRNGRISVPELARYTGYSERSIYRILHLLKARGVVYSIVNPGHTAVYYLTYTYCAAPPTPDKRDGGHPYKPIDNYKPPPHYRPRASYIPYQREPGPVLTYKESESYEQYAARVPHPLSSDAWFDQITSPPRASAGLP